MQRWISFYLHHHITASRSSSQMADSKPPENLIIVCCHGIWQGGPSHGADESEWLVADFQRGETETFAQHAKAGIRSFAESRNTSILIFSGCVLLI